jgi:hypothetical protein
VKTHHKAKPVLDTKTGKQYLSAILASKDAKCSPEHLRNQLNGTISNKTTFKYL